jgi:general stress protein 26
MKRLQEGIIKFFLRQSYAIITTIDKNGCPHNSCKGIVEIGEDGKVYLLDLYKERTYENLKQNPHITITAVDEHKFIGYCLKGTAAIVKKEELKSHTLNIWEDKIKKRISNRLLRNLHGEKGHAHHPEALLPQPEYLIVVDVKEILDLTPHHIRQGVKR